MKNNHFVSDVSRRKDGKEWYEVTLNSVFEVTEVEDI